MNRRFVAAAGTAALTAVALTAIRLTSPAATAEPQTAQRSLQADSSGSSFTIGGKTFPNQNAYIAEGRWCSTPKPSAAAFNRVQNEIAMYEMTRDMLVSPLAPTMMMPFSSGLKVGMRGPGTVTIPVYFHVITNTSGEGGLTQAEIQAQIDVLNKAYAGQDAERSQGQGPSMQKTADTPFRFTLVGVDRTANNNWFNNASIGTSAEFSMKNTLRKGGPNALNIYTANLQGGLLGWAYFPWMYADQPKLDGAVIHYATLPGGALPDAYNKGDTATHEVGHWLGLLHTFQDGCTLTNDGVAETPAESGPYGGDAPSSAALYPDTCKGSRFPGRDPIENFMDYSNNASMFQFTQGQASRADALVARYRGL